MSEQKHAPGTLPIAGQTIHPRVLDRGKYGYAVEYPDGFVSACPSESVARLNAVAPDLLEDLQYIDSAADLDMSELAKLNESEIVTLQITAGALVDIKRHIAKATQAD